MPSTMLCDAKVKCIAQLTNDKSHTLGKCSSIADEDSAVDTAISSSVNDGRLLHLPVFFPLFLHSLVIVPTALVIVPTASDCIDVVTVSKSLLFDISDFTRFCLSDLLTLHAFLSNRFAYVSIAVHHVNMTYANVSVTDFSFLQQIC
ncbi:hypothetical protein F511_32553 [Dorcoceras hygrometricum]|uniref:Uncharacterized protein n=1 Tax=Dorcoceras hygrometricum TaxID=472368 RepID=A0A2Z7C197_9LAMI|nr:hypothetical protein F511_32553 [Dorcoceras hygrometricum]